MSDKVKRIKERMRGEFENQVESLKGSGRSLILTAAGSFVLMIAAALAVFFMSVQGAEKVMMPDVTGKNVYTGLFELQKKELYAKINFRYSDDDSDIGMILEQSPRAGSIIKAYRRVTITVSRGKSLTVMENYEGKMYQDVRSRFEVLYAGEAPLVEVAAPVYVASDLPRGTVLAQSPEQGTDLYSAVTLTLVVSSGNEKETVSVPEKNVSSVQELLDLMKDSRLAFRFTQVPGDGTFSVTLPHAELSPYADVYSEVSFVPRKDSDEIITGLFTYELPDYPFPVPVRLESIDKEGNARVIIDFMHPGKTLTVPYEVKVDSTLTLYVLDERKAAVQIN
ncbi:MAG: PASTA domain-containing protein [Treponema sp.]|nr:PASTA domain-containing protein [Treponema sp.]